MNRRSDPHLLSLSDGARRVVAEEAANRLRRAADEVAILKRSFFGRRPMCRVLCSPCRCSRQTPWRINGSVCDVHATLGGPFELAMVWEREDRQHREIFCFMVHVFQVSDFAVLRLFFGCGGCWVRRYIKYPLVLLYIGINNILSSVKMTLDFVPQLDTWLGHNRVFTTSDKKGGKLAPV